MPSDPFPCKGHDVVQWSFEPVSGFPYTEWWCFDCERHGSVRWNPMWNRDAR